MRTEGTCQVCGRVCWTRDERGRWVHECCRIEIRWATWEHRPDCEACRLADSAHQRGMSRRAAGRHGAMSDNPTQPQPEPEQPDDPNDPDREQRRQGQPQR